MCGGLEVSTRGKFGRGVGLGNAIVGQFNRAYKRPTPAVTEKKPIVSHQAAIGVRYRYTLHAL